MSANLFQLGGHSLTAMRILIRLRKEFNIKLDIQIFMKDLSILSITGLVATSQHDLTLPNNIDSISVSKNAEIQAQQVLSAEASTIFNLTADFPSRFLIVKVSEELHYLSIVLHHICTDGWSMGIIEKELSIAYNSDLDSQDPRLWPLSVRYRDYSMWGKTKQNTTKVEDQLQYQEKHLKGVAPLELPSDFLRPEELSCNWDEVTFDISASCIEMIQNLALKNTTSLFSVLLTAFRTTLY
ncbi:hypothetical protein M422DRAFT_268492 [Sphaerobolus stellatus SS14]|uniref:Carrier domain-containing protein n=1 Tax=Sphaerobolus stellatus (strain SS14) TaxID=990650 RepID=A0A0C9UXD9_SPHS4|nr:hypothetical protein M422DRAFT_268492 [Sphaerobolus stellatus SS14]